ncbi:hypothetical protein GEMRC1_001145 [Eukaryota sp. GEM-RC1]
MSFSLPPTETLSIILNESSLCNQTITFGGESIEVNNFFAFLKSFFGKSFTLNESKAFMSTRFHFLHRFHDLFISLLSQILELMDLN